LVTTKAADCDSECKTLAKTLAKFDALKDLAMGYVVGDGLDINKLYVKLTKVCERMERKGIEFDMSFMDESVFMAALEVDPKFMQEKEVKALKENKLAAKRLARQE